MGDPLPRVSVIVFVRDDPSRCEAALASLRAQEDAGVAEILLADGSGGAFVPPAAGSGPTVRHLRLDAAPMPVLKAAAIRAARAPLVAILDPTDVAGPGWLRAILDEFPADPRVAAVGGEVELGGADTPANRGAYLFEYGAFAPPMRAGPTEGDLPGNNVAYRRSALVEDCADLLVAGFWKPFFHARLRALGRTFHVVPTMRVRHETHHRLLPFCRSRHHYGRCFGAMRLRRCSPGRRWVYRLGAPAVIGILVLKQLARALRHPGRRRLLPRAALPLLAICASWGSGEWAGYWFGAGRSCEQVY
jgi:hypothetical protein